MTINDDGRPRIRPVRARGVGSTVLQGRPDLAALEQMLRAPAAPAARLPVRHPHHRVARWQHVLPYALLGLVAGYLAFRNVAHAPVFQDDEGTYTFQARAIYDGLLAPYSYWYDHPPFGWMQLAAFGWIPDLLGLGGSAVGAMRYVVASYLVVTTLLIYALARRLRLHKAFAAGAALLFVLSPLTLELGRQVFLDNIAMPWILAAFVLALSPKQNLLASIGAGVCFSIGVLSKETMAVYGPVLLFVLWQNAHHRTRSFSVVGFLTIGGLVLLSYPLMALLKGELFPREGRSTLWDALLFQLVEREGSGYIWEDGSQKAQLFDGWSYYDSSLLLGGLLAAGVMLVFRRYRWVGLAVIMFSLPVVASQGYLPAMYIMAVLPFLALAVAAVFHEVWSRWSAAVSTTWLRRGIQVVMASVLLATLHATLVPAYEDHLSSTLTEDKNAEWDDTVAWVKGNLARDTIIAVPPSMWQEFRDAGWPDEWSVVSAEKVDLDPSEFPDIHPEGWRALDYVVLNPTVKNNLDYLGLDELQQAVDNSTIAWEQGGTTILKVDK